MYIAERCISEGEWIEIDDKLYHDLSDAIAVAKQSIKPSLRANTETAVRVWDTKTEDVAWQNF